MAKETATLILKVKQTGQKTIKNIANGIAKIGKAAIAGLGVLTATAGVALKAWRQQELAVNQLNQSLVQQGIFSKKLSNEYQQMASELQKVTTFGDEAILSAQAQLQAYAGQEKITKDLTKSILDFAAAQGVDLKTAAALVGKTIGSSTNALARYGIEIEAGGTKQEKMAALTDALNKKFGGQAEVAAQGTGKMIQLKNRFGDIVELIGKALIPAFEFVVEELEDFLGAAEDLTAKNPFGEFARVTLVVLENIKFGFKQLGAQIGNIVGFWVTNISKIIGPLAQAMEGDFKGAWAALKMNAKTTAFDIKELFTKGFETTTFAQTTIDGHKELNENIARINKKFADQEKNEREKSEENLRASNDRKREIQAESNVLTFEQEQEFNEQMKVFDEEFKQQRLDALSFGNIQEQEKLAQHERIMSDMQKKERLKRLDQNIKIAQTENEKLAAMRQKEVFLQQEASNEKKKDLTNLQKFRELMGSQEVSNAQSVFGQMRGLSESNSTTLNRIAQLAAIANISISTARGVGLALGTFPPPFGFAAGAAVAASGAIQIAKVRGVELADGGIIKATQGGIQATIGEGGRDEAVIPLDDTGQAGNTTVNITVNGGFLGDEATAREFAIAVDRGLFDLRKDNASVAFDTAII